LDVAGRSSFAVPRQVLIHFDGSCCGASLALPKLRMCAASFQHPPLFEVGHLRHPCSGYAGAFLGGCHRLGLLIFAPCPKQITKRHVGASCSSTVRH
jgi:hypothetical protein